MLRPQVIAYQNLALIVLAGFVALSSFSVEAAPHRILVQGNNQLAVVDREGKIEWSMPWGGIHDVHVLENGHILTQKGPSTVAEIDPKTKEIVWSYDAALNNNNQGKRVEVHAFQPLGEGRMMIAESGSGRIIEIDRRGNLLNQVALKRDKPDAHHDTRLARKLKNGNYLVCHENDGAVREYDSNTGQVVWEYDVPLFDKPRRGGNGPDSFGNQVFGAVRLDNGNTLIATGNGHSVLEVSPGKEIVWKLDQNDLPGITLAWVTTIDVLPNGNYLIGNCHAGPENPLVVEIEPQTKRIVWTLDKHKVFGNSVPNTHVLDIEGEILR